eukprot:scaffold5664_cov115-Isochrysis_galbana.AAC.18
MGLFVRSRRAATGGAAGGSSAKKSKRRRPLRAVPSGDAPGGAPDRPATQQHGHTAANRQPGHPTQWHQRGGGRGRFHSGGRSRGRYSELGMG